MPLSQHLARLTSAAVERSRVAARDAATPIDVVNERLLVLGTGDD